MSDAPQATGRDVAEPGIESRIVGTAHKYGPQIHRMLNRLWTNVCRLTILGLSNACKLGR